MKARPHIVPTCRRMLKAFLALSMASCATFGQTAEQTVGAWRMNFIPYYWGPDLNLRLRLGDVDQQSGQSFLQEDWEFKPNVVGLAFGAVRKNWGLVFAGETLDSDFDVLLPDGHPGEVEMDWQRVDLSLLYQWHWTPYQGSDLFVTPWAGLRYRHLRLRLVDPSAPDAEEVANPEGLADAEVLSRDGAHWVEPLLGLRAQWFARPKWSLSVAGNIEGFVQDQTAWSATGWIKHHLSKEFNFGIGYRYDSFDFGEGTDPYQWSADGRGQGVVVGLELDYYMVSSEEGDAWGHLANITPPEQRPEEIPTPPGLTETDVQGVPETSGESDPIRDALDRGHDFLNEKLDAGVETVDTWMLDDYRPRLSRKKSRFFLAVDTRMVELADGDHDLEIKPSVDAKVDLPNLEQQVKLALSSTSVDEKPGTDPFDREEGVNLGLETDELIIKRMKFKIGIRSSPAVYTALSWRPYWRHNRWRFSPEARAYYRTDKGVGFVGAMGVSHAIKDRFRGAYLPSIEWAEHLDWEVEWLHNLSFAYLFEGDDEDKHRALFTNGSVRGIWGEGPVLYRWLPISYRAPLYKKWLYWELGPEIVWRKSDRWEPEPTLRFTVSALFWGTKER